ncbi:MAG: Mrp/NBP35 family ATP-binding protein [Anaerolineae bacterium]|nr:Mrp/NBP35 family ATP-binding protein [Chloroflexota bacterium]
MPNEQLIRDTLAEVMDPELHRNIVELGMVHDIATEGSKVSFTLALTVLACPMRNQIQQDARNRLLALDGVTEVEIALREMTDEEKRAIQQAPEPEGAAAGYNHIARTLAVVSGKGGVGKSTVSALLAIAMQRKGYRVGLLDADITGPSIPKMLLQGNRRPLGSDNGILPVTTASGIKIMSINLLLEDPNQAVIWRGPMISGAIQQFYRDVAWGDLDYLIVDLPPGTSDASLTVMQSIPLDGIVLVTTPQSLSGMVVRKAASMAAQLQIPVLGIVENMSYAQCPECGHRIALFGESKAQELADTIGAPLLGELPVLPGLAELADTGALEQASTDAFQPVVDAIVACRPA